MSCSRRSPHPVVHRTTRNCTWLKWIVTSISGISWHTTTVRLSYFHQNVPFQFASPPSRLVGPYLWTPSQHSRWACQWLPGCKILSFQRCPSSQTHPRRSPLRALLLEHRWSLQTVLGGRARFVGGGSVRLSCPSPSRVLCLPG